MTEHFFEREPEFLSSVQASLLGKRGRTTLKAGHPRARARVQNLGNVTAQLGLVYDDY